jgi:LPXTG-motif cell wall-anchored protein
METEEADANAESANGTDAKEVDANAESANDTGDYDVVDYEVDDYDADASKEVTLSISRHYVPLLADSENQEDENEPVYDLTLEGSWYELVSDGIVIGIPVTGFCFDDDDNIAEPTGINTMNEYDEPAVAETAVAETTVAETTADEPDVTETTAVEPTDAEPTVTEKTRSSGGGGGGSDSGGSDSTPSGMTAASTEETKTIEQTTEAESEPSEIPEIPEKPFYQELPDIPGNPDGTLDIPEGTEVEIYDLNNPAEPVYRGAYSDDIDLPAGRYEIVMLDDEGVPLASGIFTIDEEGTARGTLPKTGDTSIPFVFLALLMSGAAVSAGVLVIRIRKIDE